MAPFANLKREKVYYSCQMVIIWQGTWLSSEYEVVGLHLIRYNYEHENKYLNRFIFQNSYNLPDDFQLLDSKHEGAFPVLNSEMEILFSVQTAGQFLCTKNQLYLPGIIYFLDLIILVVLFQERIYGIGSRLFHEAFRFGCGALYRFLATSHFQNSRTSFALFIF